MTQYDIEVRCEVLKEIIKESEQRLEQAKKKLKDLQNKCNHSKHEYHHRCCAEDDCYYTCLTCGYQWT